MTAPAPQNPASAKDASAAGASPKTAPSPALVTTSDAPPRPPLSHALRKWLKHMLGTKQDASLKEALEEVIEEHEEQADEQMAPEEKVMLHNILALSEIRVSDIMIPRPDIAAIPHEITLSALKSHLIEQNHTRVPVYKDTLDQVLGFIHVKDMLPMLSEDKPFDLKAVMRNLLFVPPSMRIIDLLVKMRHAGTHMAIVVDEYGGTDGLVTMEDMFEEIVGDIQDEHDQDEDKAEKISRIGDGVFEVSARIRIERLEKELGLTLVTEEKADEFDTLGGLIFFQLGRVPSRGEIVSHVSGLHFEILEADSRRIRKVRIRTS